MKITLRSAISAVVLSTFLCGTASAATLAYWRLEDWPDFLFDSAGGDDTLGNFGSVSQYTLPGSGAGSDFPDPIPLTGEANAKAA